MADIRSLAESRTALLWFDPRKLKVKPGLNSRDVHSAENESYLEELTQSIMANGFLPSHPLEVFQEDGEVYITAGHFRLAASMRAIQRGYDLKVVPAVPERRGTSEAERFLNQQISNSGKHLTPMEQGAAFKRALGAGMTMAEIARHVSKSASFVADMIDLQGAPTEVRQMVSDGVVSSTLASKVVKKAGSAKGLQQLQQAAKTVKAEGGRRVTEKHVRAVAPDTPWTQLRTFMIQHKDQPEDITDALIGKVMDKFGVERRT